MRLSNLAEYLDPVTYDLENPSCTSDGPFYAGLAQRAGGPILELGAGTGRIAIPLAQAGFTVTGLDLCAPMLAHAKAKSGALPIRWVAGDSTHFELGQQYGLIFIAGHGFQAFLSEAALDGLLRSVRRHLRPGGLFAFDTRNPAPVHLEADLVETDWFAYQHPERGQVRVSGYQVYDAATQIQTWTTFRRWGDHHESQSQIQLRYAAPAALEALLAAHGFAVLERYGDWSLGPVTAESPELISVVQALA